MTHLIAPAVLDGLKDFQRDAVEHVFDRFYGTTGAQRSGRFLVADETGLGKSIVARGLVAKAIDHLQEDEDIDRIDIVYICSNQDLARQNLHRLNVTGDRHISMATRLTLLALETAKLSEPSATHGKKVNLVSFTPDTSFKTGGWRMGAARERALLTIVLDEALSHDEAQQRATRVLLRGAARKLENFMRRVRELEAEIDSGPGLDRTIIDAFLKASRVSGLLSDFAEFRDELIGQGHIPRARWDASQELISRLRHHLATAGIGALQADLVILDEFQRFRHLLDPEASEAAELADKLFSDRGTKVLLLSATPYKPYTANGEAGDDHARDFLATIRFLARGDGDFVEQVRDALAANRSALAAGDGQDSTARQVRNLLLSVMSRSERPPLADAQDMVVERPLRGSTPTVDDIADWKALQRLGRAIDARFELAHWKSIPYFASFMDTYRAGTRTRELLESRDADVVRAIAGTRGIERNDVRGLQRVDLGNGVLRALAEETVDAGWWQLLWMPASLPYLEPAGPYAGLPPDTTKHLVFSAWNGVPTAVSALLSHEAERRVRGSAGPDTAATAHRLAWSERANELRTLMLFWPHPELASLGDPRRLARAKGGPVAAKDALSALRLDRGVEADSPWSAFFSFGGAVPNGVEHPHRMLVDAFSQPDDEEGASSYFAAHVEAAIGLANHGPASHPDLRRLALHAPGSIAWRSAATLAGVGAGVSPCAVWSAAWRMSLALRSLFNRTSTAQLLDGLYGEEEDYWRKVLRYCADGNLQAVMDEYLFQLRSERGGTTLDDQALDDIADAVATALSLRTANLEGHEASADRAPIRFPTRFAVRYGGASRSMDGKAEQRLSDVRAAFNSPFAPFILTSTSVGQEGIDFHWWSHAVVHWNLPANPVDFEQREGRVHRYLGHAVRKNIAARHATAAYTAESSPWDAALAEATRMSEQEGNVFSPWWIYPGEARIMRRIATLPLSREHERYARLRDDLARYRLTLGQPRQEDLLRLLERRAQAAHLRPIDLSPPRSVG